jgi:RNA polymerase sigma-70 factor (ECF subfamily)
LNATEERLKALFVRALDGDEAAYGAFLKDLCAHLRAFLRRRLGRAPDEVEDLVQETLLAVHNQRHTYAPDEPLTAWLHAIAKYKLVDLLRRRSRRDLLNDALDDAPELFSSADNEAAQARRDVAKLLESLPERQRMPIVYVKLQGMAVSEAAEKLGMSESAVKVAVHRGLKALAARIRGNP